MQSIFRLPWCSDPLGSDASRQMRQDNIPLLNRLKRKRSEGVDLCCEPDKKRKRPTEQELRLLSNSEHVNNHVWQAPAHAVAKVISGKYTTSQSTTASAAPAQGEMPSLTDGEPLGASQIVTSTLTPLQQTIEHQFNLEILMKHRELRLIDQELAKCQVALEQLRRCQIIPFPGAQSMSAQVSTGTGPALRPVSGQAQPVAPAAWGVADGPYTKHYAKWLLPDSTFDPSDPLAAAAEQQSLQRSDGRTSRHITAPTSAKSSKTRKVDPTVTNFQSPLSRNKNGPLVLKRASDNQFVKLVCVKCHRSDFSSVQGFLNHCRIAHKLDYKSHEAAAQDCGQPLASHEADLAVTAPLPVVNPGRAAIVKPVQPLPAPISRVHQLNHAILPRPTWKRQRLDYIDRLDSQPTIPVLNQTSQQYPSDTKTTTCSSAPFLSAQLSKSGKPIDLAAILAKLREPLDFGPDSDDERDSTQPTPSPARGTSFADTGRPTSRKGFNQNNSRPRPAPLAESLTSDVLRSPESPRSHDDLSPHAADSNPGLVSDHDDDDVISDIEDSSDLILPTAPGPFAGCGAADDAMDLDLQVDDDRHEHAVVIRSQEVVRAQKDFAGEGKKRGKIRKRR